MTSYEHSRTHRLRVMSGRDPNERHQAATPLELLYDLTFVVAFGVAGEQFAHLLAEGHFAAGLTAFGLAIFAICAATGAGLHVAAYYIGHEAHIGATATVLTVAVPLAVYVLTLFALYTFLVRAVDPFHIALLAGTAALLVLPVMLATIGAPMAVCLVVLMLAPLVPVIGYETLGYRHMAIAVQRTLARDQQTTG
jgi:hypothetical protein